MKLQIQSIHFTADQKLLDFIQKKLDKLETFNDRIMEGEVYLHLENTDTPENKLVNVKLYLPGTSAIVAKEQASSFEEATDKLYDNLKRQILKLKDKMQSHH
ncbi:ribosome-associated translation inhibitor RaiA [Cytophagaceae bacterium ABcell3]|nr:ribosome-associated translation inhibitor RaiA [Cytophagaceae bacterium ABcell3]